MSQTSVLSSYVIPPGTLVQTETGNVGGPVAPDVTNNLNVVGVGAVVVTGNPATHTLSIAIPESIESLTGNSGGAVTADVLNNINVVGASPLDVVGNPGTNTLTISTSGAVATSYLTDDTNSAIPAANVLKIAGGANIHTSSATNVVTVALNDSVVIPVSGSLTIGGFGAGVVQTTALGTLFETTGTDGQLLMASSSGAPAWNVITAGNNIGISNGASSITVAVNGTTNHDVLLGNASGSISSLPNGTTGEVLTAVSGADPIWAAPSGSTELASGILGLSDSTLGNTGAVSYAGPFFTGTSGTTRANFQFVVPIPGVISNLYLNLDANASTSNMTATLNVNGVNSSLVATATALTTGEFSDLVHVVSVAAGDLIVFEFSQTATGTTHGSLSARFTPSGTSSMSGGILGATLAGASSSTTQTLWVGPYDGTQTTQALAEVVMPVSGIIDNLFVNVPTNASTTGVAIKVNKNGVNTLLATTVTALTTGVFSDVVHSFTFNAGDRIQFEIGQSTTGTLDNISITARLSPLGTAAGIVQLLEGNSGGPVGPDLGALIHVVGDGTTANVVGDPLTNTLTISSLGGSIVAYTPINTSPYVVLNTDYFISVDCTSVTITVELPNAPLTGKVFVIKDRLGNANVRNITITTVGGAVTIDGATSYTLDVAYSAIKVLFNGTSYEIF